MSSLAVLPSAMLARIHSVWQIRQVCYITAAIWSFCFWDTPKEKKNKTNCQQILLLAQQTVLHRWSCLTEQRLIPGGQLIITPEKCLLLYNAGFTCSWRMNSVRHKQRASSPVPWPLYCALLPGWGSRPALSASHENSWSGLCADIIAVTKKRVRRRESVCML